MAVVDLAIARGPDGFERELVLKRIRPRLSRDPRFARMFVDEARIVSQLIHSNIVHIYEFGKIDDEYFLAMEYVPGADLHRLQRTLSSRQERFPVGLAAFVVVEICRALDYAHRKRTQDGRLLHIVHRDVSPQNVLISHEGAVKLADFGIARAAEREEQTLDDVVKGKVAYMSPEQLRGEPLDGRSDIYAAGILLYQLVARAHPYAADNDGQTIERALAHDWPPPSDHAPDIPAQLDAIVDRATAAHRAERFDTAGELAEALEQLLFDARLRATASELAGLMHRLYDDESASASAPVEVALDLVVASGLRSDDHDLPSYTAQISSPKTTPATPSRKRTDPMFRPPPDLVAPSPEGTDEDGGTEQLSAVRWQRPPAAPNRDDPDRGRHEPNHSGDGPSLRPRRGERWLAASGIALGLVVITAFWFRSPEAPPTAPATPPPEPAPLAVLDAALTEEPAAEVAASLDAEVAASLDAEVDQAEPRRRESRGDKRPQRQAQPRSTGWLRVATRPHWAEVYIDGRRMGTTPLLVRVPAGRRHLRLINPQLGRVERRSVTVAADQPRTSPATVMVDGF